MAVYLSPVGGVAAQFFDNDGNVLSGGKIFTYAAGTNTPIATYTTSSGAIPHSNPIILDSAGRVPTGEIWLTDSINYKFVLNNSSNVLIGTYDNISGINSNFISFTNQQQIVVATAGQTVFNLSISYQPGTNSLSVFVDGVNQYGPSASYAYVETDSDTVTFTSGLHVGAVVKFTTTQQQGAGAVDASQVSYTPAGTGAITTNVQTKLRESVSVFDFMSSAQIADVLAGTASIDVTAAIQAGVTYCVQKGNVLFMPAGHYLVIDTINIPTFTQIAGEHKNMTAKGFGVEPKGTRIKFNPTSAKSLFVASGVGPFGGYRAGYSIEGLYIAGNSTVSTSNSVYAINVDSIVESNFDNLAIQFFQTGIRVNNTINNRFQYVRVINCYAQCVLYAGGVATTDVWDQCYFSNAPIGVQTSGVSLGIRFSDCIFETLEAYGVNLVKEIYGFSFTNCYSEDVPSLDSNGSMFRVGYAGTTLAGAPQLSIIGGLYGGSNGSSIGSFVDVDFTDGVSLGGCQVSRYVNGIKTSANTIAGQVVGFGWVAANVTNQVSDATKISGLSPLGNFNDAGTRNNQTIFTPRLVSPVLRGNTAGTADIEMQGNIVYVGKVAALVGGVAAPSVSANYAQLYIDIADGDLKVIFGNGTVKTIATN
jgi:hypothetical protein